MSVENNTNNVDVTAQQWFELSKAAEIAFHKAYAPYSAFKVGAAALSADNVIVQGCNVENASYGLTVCAERNCIAHGVIANQSIKPVKFTALVIYTAQEKLTPPCGACRQVISEFFPTNAFVMAVNHLNEQQKWTVEQLLPDAFTPMSLLNKTEQ